MCFLYSVFPAVTIFVYRDYDGAFGRNILQVAETFAKWHRYYCLYDLIKMYFWQHVLLVQICLISMGFGIIVLSADRLSL